MPRDIGCCIKFYHFSSHSRRHPLVSPHLSRFLSQCLQRCSQQPQQLHVVRIFAIFCVFLLLNHSAPRNSSLILLKMENENQSKSISDSIEMHCKSATHQSKRQFDFYGNNLDSNVNLFTIDFYIGVSGVCLSCEYNCRVS